MNLCDLGFGKLVSGIFKKLASHYLGLGLRNCFREFSGTCLAAAGHQKIQPQETRIRPRNCEQEFGTDSLVFVDCENWEEQLSNFWRTTKNESIVLFYCFQKVAQLLPCFFQCTGSFQALASPYQAAAGHQKIQPQEMRIWGLGLRNCFREFSGAYAPLSGRSRPPKNPATGNENPGLGLAKLFYWIFRGLRPLIWPQPATKKSSHRQWESGAWACEIVLGNFQRLASPYLAAAGHQKIQPQEIENLSLAKLSEIPAGTFFIIWASRPRNCEQNFCTDSLVL